MKHPHRILLTVAGSSPAIVTETLYALSQQDNPFIPTEIHIITTSGVVKNIEATLLGTTEKKGAIKALCEDYQLTQPHIDQSTIHVISNENGDQLNDIITEEDNEATANFIIDKVRELTTSEDTCLHVSIAGGRKTMTYYLGYTMSVFGRIQDKMSHVLVENDIRSHDFFYPTPKPKMIKDFSGNELDASKVKVMLGCLPYIRLRDGLTDDLLKKDNKKTFSEIIEVAQRQLAPLHIRVIAEKDGHSTYSLYIDDEKIKMEPILKTIYIWYLGLRKLDQDKTEFNDGTSDIHMLHSKKEKDFTDFSINEIEQKISKIKSALTQKLLKTRADKYTLKSSGDGTCTYRVSDEVLPENITLPDEIIRLLNKSIPD